MSDDGIGLLEMYTPPALSLVPNTATTYSHDASRRRTSTTLPDGRIVNQVFDAAGRLSRTELPGTEGVIQRTYDTAPVTGHAPCVRVVATPSAPDLARQRTVLRAGDRTRGATSLPGRATAS